MRLCRLGMSVTTPEMLPGAGRNASRLDAPRLIIFNRFPVFGFRAALFVFCGYVRVPVLRPQRNAFRFPESGSQLLRCLSPARPRAGGRIPGHVERREKLKAATIRIARNFYIFSHTPRLPRRSAQQGGDSIGIPNAHLALPAKRRARCSLFSSLVLAYTRILRSVFFAGSKKLHQKPFTSCTPKSRNQN